MSTSSRPAGLPDPASLADAFHVYEVDVTDEDVRYYGEPLEDRTAVERAVEPLFGDSGYHVSLTRETGEYVLVATERSTSLDEIVHWRNPFAFSGGRLRRLLDPKR
jgi:hypothetical protein